MGSRGCQRLSGAFHTHLCPWVPDRAARLSPSPPLDVDLGSGRCVCEHPGGDGCGCGRDVPAAGQGACSHGHCEETTPHPRDSLCCPQVWPCRAGWVPPARHGEGFGSGPWQPCVARGWDTGHGNTSTSGKLCSQEGWIAAGTANNLQVHGGKQCWRLPNKLPGITTRAWCLCIKAEARASAPTESGQIIN